MFNKYYLYIYGFFIGIFALFIYPVFITDHPKLYNENGLIENLQALTLILTSILFLLNALKKNRNDRLFMLFFAWLTFSFFLREVDVEDFDLPSIIIFLGGHGVGRNTMLALGFLTIIFFYIKERKFYNPLIKKFALSFEGVLIIQSAIFLVCSDFFEKSHSLAYHQFYEELFELYGYLLLLIAALLLRKKQTL